MQKLKNKSLELLRFSRASTSPKASCCSRPAAAGAFVFDQYQFETWKGGESKPKVIMLSVIRSNTADKVHVKSLALD